MKRLLPVAIAFLLGPGISRSRAAEAGTQVWTLETAITHALTNNPDARLSQHRIRTARAQLQQANAGFWPQLQLQSSYTRSDNPIHVFGFALNQRSFDPSLDFNDVPDADNVNARTLVTLPLYRGGRTSAGRQSARARTEAARLDAQAVRLALSFEVTRAYHTVRKTAEFIRATEAAVQAFTNNLDIATKRFHGGTLLKTDVLDVEVRLAQAREDLVRARNAHALSHHALKNLLGLESQEPPLLLADTSPPMPVPEPQPAPRRPELEAAHQQERAAEAELRRAQGGWRPNVSALGSLDYDYGDRFDGDGQSYTVGLLAQWDLWDGQLTRGKVNEARAQVEAAQEEQRRVQLAIDLEVQQARLQLEEASQRLAVTARTVAQATESVQLTRARFEQGLAIATQLIDAEAALTAARVRRAEAEADQLIAVAALRKALGLPLSP